MTHPNEFFLDWKIALSTGILCIYFLYCHPINELSAVAVLVPKRAHLRLSPTTVWALTERDINPDLKILMVRHCSCGTPLRKI
jgi:hypothetical protein